MALLSHIKSALPVAQEILNTATSAVATYSGVAVSGNVIAFSDNGNDRVYSSVDGGSTWNNSNPGITNLQGIACNSTAIVLVNGASAGAAFRRTTDNGSNWSDITNPTTGAAINYMFSAGNTFIGLKGGTSTEIARSTDSGATFSSVAITSGSHISAVGNGSGTWLITSSGTTTAYRSTDDGATWSSVTLPDVPAINVGVGYVNGKFRLLIGAYSVADSTTAATGSWTVRNIGMYSGGAPSRTSYFNLASGNYMYFISSGQLYKVHLENTGETISYPILNAGIGVTYAAYCNGKIFCTSVTSGLYAQSILKISNIP